ncbi:MAG: dihydropteroate synthase [Spirochaetia bacterium]|nr:dihydropteroate synthase [Spirochaetia bacterium]
MVKIFGIVNITEDSFSDGGLYLETEKAVDHCRKLTVDGCDVLDLGAASSHPDSKDVNTEEEIARLAAVIHHIKKPGVKISIDSFRPEVQKFAVAEGVDYLNDIQGFPFTESYDFLADAKCSLIVMHSIQRLGRATKTESDPEKLLDEILAFFEERIASLVVAGIDKKRLILDPGMGFFLGNNPESSLIVLKNLKQIKHEFHLPVMVSVSKKSFLGMITGKEVKDRGPATLSAELYASLHGADFIRTHNVSALKDAVNVWKSIQSQPVPEL